MRLHRVVHHRLRPVLGLDDDVGFGEAAVEVTSLVPAWVGREVLAPHGLVGVEERLERLPFDVDQIERGACLCRRVGGDRGDGGTVVAGLGGQLVDVARPESGVDAGRFERGRKVDRGDARIRVRRAQDRRVQHPRQANVRRVTRLAAGPDRPVRARRRSPDDVERTGRPLLEQVLLDHEPNGLVAALHLFLRADQSRQVSPPPCPKRPRRGQTPTCPKRTISLAT